MIECPPCFVCGRPSDPRWYVHADGGPMPACDGCGCAGSYKCKGCLRAEVALLQQRLDSEIQEHLLCNIEEDGAYREIQGLKEEIQVLQSNERVAIVLVMELTDELSIGDKRFGAGPRIDALLARGREFVKGTM